MCHTIIDKEEHKFYNIHEGSMNQGMLWFDDRKDVSVAQKIAAALKFYEQKYGSRPSCCYIHSDKGIDEAQTDLGLRVEVSPYILPNHYLLEEN